MCDGYLNFVYVVLSTSSLPLHPLNHRPSFPLGFSARAFYTRYDHYEFRATYQTYPKECKKSNGLTHVKKVFRNLKHCLTSAPVLALPSSSSGYAVHCDATRVELGCVLMQHGKVIVIQLVKEARNELSHARSRNGRGCVCIKNLVALSVCGNLQESTRTIRARNRYSNKRT